ncbi:MAG: multidrug efflux SMR transporter [Okeania sp. SIO3I5]|uniref:DMT family transporter n=1 Tax=Okeania sp. SIO3I5 TaxID=2607805 RepID=UPI0013B90D6D|nr:multidrug efflux SMR transporter [Okeania sp. SIO3I5]NEQ41210.1 multidrug efflux SMR transporter [Okeania sp. SIO3I5]
MDFLYLVLSSLFSALAFVFLKLSKDFTRIYPSILTFLMIGIDLFFFSLALKTIHMGIAYTICCGLGTLLVVTISITWFKESANKAKIISIILIVLGVALLEIT